MADPTLQGQYPARGLYQALAVAAMCVQEQPTLRPLIADVVTALTFLASQHYDHETEQFRTIRLTAPGTPPRRRRRHSEKEQVVDLENTSSDGQSKLTRY